MCQIIKKISYLFSLFFPSTSHLTQALSPKAPFFVCFSFANVASIHGKKCCEQPGMLTLLHVHGRSLDNQPFKTRVPTPFLVATTVHPSSSITHDNRQALLAHSSLFWGTNSSSICGFYSATFLPPSFLISSLTYNSWIRKDLTSTPSFPFWPHVSPMHSPQPHSLWSLHHCHTHSKMKFADCVHTKSSWRKKRCPPYSLFVLSLFCLFALCPHAPIKRAPFLFEKASCFLLSFPCRVENPQKSNTPQAAS